jgi:DNA-binding NarL/FixJ family response regulator
MKHRMKQRTIGGPLRYDLLAQANRPTDETALRREVLALFARGLTERDIAGALRLDPTTVRRLLIGATNA